MTEFESVFLMVFMYLQGLGLGYIIWAPMTTFKQGLLDGLTFKWLWSRK